MSFRYTYFGSLALPELMPGGETEDMSLGPTRDGVVELPGGGWYDAYGASQAPLERQTIQVPAVLQASTAALLDDLFQSWQTAIGKRRPLLRQWSGDNSVQWRYVRLQEIRVLDASPVDTYIAVMLTFALLDTSWRSAGHSHVDNGAFDAGLDGWTASSAVFATVIDGVLHLSRISDSEPQVTVSQTIAVTPGATYRVSVRAYKEYLAGAGHRGEGLGVTGLTGASVQHVSAEKVWETLVTQGVASGSSITVTLYGFAADLGAGGRVLFDDAEVARIYPLVNSPVTVTVAPEGNAPITDPVLRITAGDAPITAVSITNTTPEESEGGVATEICHISYGATIAAGKELVIDCGAYSVKNNGTEDLANLTRQAGHRVDGLFELRSGETNTIVVTFTGGGTGSVMRLEYEARWH